jgi:hypothetical protein
MTDSLIYSNMIFYAITDKAVRDTVSKKLLNQSTTPSSAPDNQ